MMGRIGLVVAAVGAFAFAGSALAGPGGCFGGAHTAQATPPPVVVMATPPANWEPKLTLVICGATSKHLQPQPPVVKVKVPSATPVLMSL